MFRHSQNQFVAASHLQNIFSDRIEIFMIGQLICMKNSTTPFLYIYCNRNKKTFFLKLETTSTSSLRRLCNLNINLHKVCKRVVLKKILKYKTHVS